MNDSTVCFLCRIAELFDGGIRCEICCLSVETDDESGGYRTKCRSNWLMLVRHGGPGGENKIDIVKTYGMLSGDKAYKVTYLLSCFQLDIPSYGTPSASSKLNPAAGK